MLGEFNRDVSNTAADITDGGALGEFIPREIFGGGQRDEAVEFKKTLTMNQSVHFDDIAPSYHSIIELKSLLNLFGGRLH